jgi:hypothetical protein
MNLMETIYSMILKCDQNTGKSRSEYYISINPITWNELRRELVPMPFSHEVDWRGDASIYGVRISVDPSCIPGIINFNFKSS